MTENRKAPLRIEEIEEFEAANRVPRAAITDEILLGVKNLDESKELELYLREILPDSTNTAHTSTEIADILTTHITVKGQPKLAGFVNKGKSTKKVTSKQVAHQVMRLQRIPNLNLLVLLAVGDIQDDIKLDVIQTAHNMNADYMIVDAVDVARILIAHHKICPKDGTPYQKGRCRTCGTPASEPIKLTLNVYEEPSFDIMTEKDVSTGAIKRYRANILTDRHYPKAILREVIKEAVLKMKQKRFYRSELVENRYGDSDADAVFLFIYLTNRDLQNFNWICRVQWINSRVPEQLRPWPFKNPEWLGTVAIDWRPEYEQLRNMYEQLAGTKESWEAQIKASYPQIIMHVEKAKILLEAYNASNLSQSVFEAEMEKLEAVARRIDRDAGRHEVPPLQCETCDSAFEGMRAHFYNVFIPFATWGVNERTWDNKLWLMNDYLKRFEEERQDFLYELKKLNHVVCYPKTSELSKLKAAILRLTLALNDQKVLT